MIATDQDQGDNGEFMYVLEDESGAFNLDQRTGWLTVGNCIFYLFKNLSGH